MSTKEVKLNAIFFYWLTISLILVFSLIIVGGLTRLTNSGLSIIEWELFKGILPPLNENSGKYILISIKLFHNINLILIWAFKSLKLYFIGNISIVY